MTPEATTGAGRGTRRTAAGSSSAAGHRRALRERPAPRAPRRVSGPTRGRVARPAAAMPRTGPALGRRARTFVLGLPDHRVLDRVIRGRAWIPILGVMLAGIVAMQVEVLKLGANIGHSIQEGTALQSRNELLRASVASLADDQRIERIAAGMGMVMPPPTGVNFLTAHRHDVRRAVAGIHAPDATSFLTALAASQAASTPPNAASAGTTPAAPVAPVGTGSPLAAAASSATTTPTQSVTPTQTAVPTQTVTPTQSVTPTQTAAPTQTVTPTAPVTAAGTSTTGGASPVGG